MLALAVALAVTATACERSVVDHPPAPSAAGSEVATPPGDDQPTPATNATAVTDGAITTVERIVDGDTLYLAGLDVRARLIGIDTPETRHPQRPVECFGREAAAHLAELVPPGTRVRVEFDVDRTDDFDRPLVYLYRADDGLFVNLRMVADGYASASTVPPNVRHAEAFVTAQRDAREARRGLWSTY